MGTIFNSNLWKKNWKIAIASGAVLVAFLVLIFAPLATIPIKTIETYYATEMQIVPVTETMIIKEYYAEPVSKNKFFSGTT